MLFWNIAAGANENTKVKCKNGLLMMSVQNISYKPQCVILQYSLILPREQYYYINSKNYVANIISNQDVQNTSCSHLGDPEISVCGDDPFLKYHTLLLLSGLDISPLSE